MSDERGDTLRQSGDSESALERYQQSLALSVEEGSAPLIRLGVHGAGLCCLDLGRDEEAEGYLEHSNQLAGKLNDPFAKADALPRRHAAQLLARASPRRDPVPGARLRSDGLARNLIYYQDGDVVIVQRSNAHGTAGEPITGYGRTGTHVVACYAA